MKNLKIKRITALFCVLFILCLSDFGYSQNPDFCERKEKFKIGQIWHRLWQKASDKREYACFGRYQPTDFNPNTPKVVWDASAGNFSNLQNEINELANYMDDDDNATQPRYKLYLNQIFAKANDATFENFDYWKVNDKDPGGKRSDKFFEPAATAKYAAFVYLIGVIKVPDPAQPNNPEAGFLFKFNDPKLDSMNIDGEAELNKYRDRALNIFHV